MTLLKDISELVKADIISKETAEKIQDFYQAKEEKSNNRLFAIFGVFGAILIGLGLILIIAHNWDQLDRAIKTIFAFIPLIIGQVLVGYTIFKRYTSLTWRESSSAFLFFAVGACISLISQIYNIPGNLGSFILIWMLLILPLVYIMKSSIISLLYIIGITFYACELGYWSRPNSEPYLYWLLLIAIIPHYYSLYKDYFSSNYLSFHNWIIPLSVLIVLGTISQEIGEFMVIAYISLLGLFYLIGKLLILKNQKLINNGYLIIGSLGTIILLLIISFDDFWKELRSKDFKFDNIVLSPEIITSVLISILAGILLYKKIKKSSIKSIEPIEVIFILFIIVFFIGLTSSVSVILINLIVFILGILTILQGTKMNHLGILNYGLLTITALLIARFFDTDISFILRGVLFIIVGIGFFVTNYWMLKKRKSYEK